jgi:hypothetical protein
MGHGEAEGCRGGAPRPRRDLGPTIPPPATLGQETGTRRPGLARDHRRDWRWARIAPGFSADQLQKALTGDRFPARGLAGPVVGQGSDVTSSAPSKRPCTPGDAPTIGDLDTTGTGPAGPRSEQQAANPAPQPPRSSPALFHLRRGRTPAQSPGTGATAHAAGRACFDAGWASCRAVPFRWRAIHVSSRIREWCACGVSCSWHSGP